MNHKFVYPGSILTLCLLTICLLGRAFFFPWFAFRIPAPARVPAGHFAATNAQVESAHCLEPVPLTTTEIDAYFAKVTRSRTAEEGARTEIAGVVFIDEDPTLLEAYLRLVTPTLPPDPSVRAWMRNTTPLPDPGDLQSKYNINPSCTRVLCAVKKIFGDVVGPKMLFLMHKYDINTSPLTWPNSQLMTDDEITDVLKVLRLIPDKLLPLGRNQELARARQGYVDKSDDEKDPTYYAVADIMVFDLWAKAPRPLREYLLLHEISHNYAKNILGSLDRTRTWIKLSNSSLKIDAQTLKVLGQTAASEHGFVSDYARKSAAEDFAESVTSYRLSPQLLFAKSREKYDFIRSLVFDGLEFKSPEDCRKPRYSDQLKTAPEESFTREAAKAAVERIKNQCRPDFATGLFGTLPHSYFGWCADFVGTLAWHEQRVQSDPHKDPEALQSFLFDLSAHRSRLAFPIFKARARQELLGELADSFMELYMSAHAAPVGFDEPAADATCRWFERNADRLQANRTKAMTDRNLHYDLSVRSAKVYQLCREIQSRGAVSKATVLKVFDEATRTAE